MVHTGQIFVSENDTQSYLALSPYNNHNDRVRTTNDEDSIYQSALSTDQEWDFELIGDSLEDGVYAYYTMVSVYWKLRKSVSIESPLSLLKSSKLWRAPPLLLLSLFLFSTVRQHHRYRRRSCWKLWWDLRDHCLEKLNYLCFSRRRFNQLCSSYFRPPKTLLICLYSDLKSPVSFTRFMQELLFRTMPIFLGALITIYVLSIFHLQPPNPERQQ